MPYSLRSMRSIVLSLVAVVTIVSGLMVGFPASAHAASTSATSSTHFDCATSTILCPELKNSESAFGYYVGHDEPATLFYSNQPGAGNHMRYQLTLPTDPSAANPLTPGKSYNFELFNTFWFGMALCATESFPEQVKTCTPDSDKNIVDPNISASHPGMAFMEMQFYPPGYVSPWPNATGSCDATKWCAAMIIFSVGQDPVAGTQLNPTCVGKVGVEYANFAFITKSGHSQGPASPLLQTNASNTPDPAQDLFMNSGDHLAVTLHDTRHGLRVEIADSTTGQSGSMTASAANGFGQVKYAPTGTSCDNVPYDFHPMYSTSSERTSVTWAVHTGDVMFSGEIGHFDYCIGSNPVTPNGICPSGNNEGIGASSEPTDTDDMTMTPGGGGCYPASSSTLVQVPGCIGPIFQNSGFDGSSYLPIWPDGTRMHPTPVEFSSPLTGSGYNVQYSRVAFETTTPLNEAQIFGTCNIVSGAGCTIIPPTDDQTKNPPGFVPAAFYPFYSNRNVGGQCVWQLGNHIQGNTNDFGGNPQYGTVFPEPETITGGGVVNVFIAFRQILSTNPCRA